MVFYLPVVVEVRLWVGYECGHAHPCGVGISDGYLWQHGGGGEALDTEVTETRCSGWQSDQRNASAALRTRRWARRSDCLGAGAFGEKALSCLQSCPCQAVCLGAGSLLGGASNVWGGFACYIACRFWCCFPLCRTDAPVSEGGGRHMVLWHGLRRRALECHGLHRCAMACMSLGRGAFFCASARRQPSSLAVPRQRDGRASQAPPATGLPRSVGPLRLSMLWFHGWAWPCAVLCCHLALAVLRLSGLACCPPWVVPEALALVTRARCGASAVWERFG